MSTIDLGNIKFNWKGTKDTSTAYAIDDVVYVDPHSYVCVQAHTNQAVNTNGNNAYWEIIASGANLPGQTGYAGKALKTDGTNLSWGDGGGVIQTFRNEFHSKTAYGGSPVEIVLYRSNYTGLTVGNKLVVWVHMFGEAHQDMSMYVERNGTRPLEGSGGGSQGKYTPIYDNNESSTPNLGGFIFIDDIVSSSQEYRFYKEGNTMNWNVNRCYDPNHEKGTTCIVAQEVLA